MSATCELRFPDQCFRICFHPACSDGSLFDIYMPCDPRNVLESGNRSPVHRAPTSSNLRQFACWVGLVGSDFFFFVSGWWRRTSHGLDTNSDVINVPDSRACCCRAGGITSENTRQQRQGVYRAEPASASIPRKLDVFPAVPVGRWCFIRRAAWWSTSSLLNVYWNMTN